MAVQRKSKILNFALLSLFVSLAWHGCGPDRDPVSSGPEELAPAAKAGGGSIPGRYIVVLRDEVGDVPGVAAGLARAHGGTPEHVYQHALKGFSLALPEQAVEALARNPQVAYIEPDQEVTIVGAPVVTGKPGGGGSAPPPQTVPWGIDRVCGTLSDAGELCIPNYAGSNRAWVIDSGIDLDHPDLNVDVGRSVNFVTRGKNQNPDDGNGHGTHVAGTIAAINNATYVVGVAPGAPVVAVRVLDSTGSGTWSWVLAGIDYVAANGVSGDVANMSIGGGYSLTVNNAVASAAAKGIRFAIAAGNNGANASNYSPASAEGSNIYTISAVDSQDVLASWSNFGNPPVDYAAPGVSVRSTWKGGGLNTISGTSMATPHVAGLLLLGSVTGNGTASGDPDGNPDPIAHL